MDVRTRAIAALSGFAFAFVASSCGQSTATNAAGTRPAAPSAVSAVAGIASATVSWTAPSSNASPISGYAVMWAGGSQLCGGSPCIVTGLTNGTSYTFTVTATNAGGSGPASAPSNSVTPTPPLPGDPVPAQLLGNWRLPEAAVIAEHGSATNIPLTLGLTATTYVLHGIVTDYSASGYVVVNSTEIDFFSEDYCGLVLPNGVGRYKWMLKGGVLHFTLLSPDPCDIRNGLLGNQSYSRTS